MQMRRLTNKQMSMVIGGESWFCTYFLADSLLTPPTENGEEVPVSHNMVVEASSAIEAADIVHARTGASQVNCTHN